MRILMVASAALFCGGVIAFVQVREDDQQTAARPAENIQPASQPDVLPKTGGKLNSNARKVAGRFIVTALTRTHLAEVWELAAPELRNTVTRSSGSPVRCHFHRIPCGASRARASPSSPPRRTRSCSRCSCFPDRRGRGVRADPVRHDPDQTGRALGRELHGAVRAAGPVLRPRRLARANARPQVPAFPAAPCSRGADRGGGRGGHGCDPRRKHGRARAATLQRAGRRRGGPAEGDAHTGRAARDPCDRAAVRRDSGAPRTSRARLADRIEGAQERPDLCGLESGSLPVDLPGPAGEVDLCLLDRRRGGPRRLGRGDGREPLVDGLPPHCRLRPRPRATAVAC